MGTSQTQEDALDKRSGSSLRHRDADSSSDRACFLFNDREGLLWIKMRPGFGTVAITNVETKRSQSYNYGRKRTMLSTSRSIGWLRGCRAGRAAHVLPAGLHGNSYWGGMRRGLRRARTGAPIAS